MILASLLVAAATAQTSMAAVLNNMNTVSSTGGALSTTVNVDKFFFDDSNTGTKFWTRVYNRASISGSTLEPGPVLRFQRGDTVTLTVNNNLGNETGTYTSLNSFHYMNTTNMHTHGLHVSAESPQDNVLMTIHPGDSYTYVYEIPDDHAGGTFWYHSHHHGSTAGQVGGGLIGAIVVEDQEGELPQDILDIPDLILLMSHTPIGDLVSKYASDTGDDLYTSSDNVVSNGDQFMLVNGQYQPTGSVTQGMWTRLRTIYSGLDQSLELQMTSNTGNCEWFLLAKDGIYVEDAPRAFGDTIYLSPGNRADVVIRCSSVGEVVLGTSSTSNDMVSQTNIVTLTVTASSGDADDDLPQFSPYRPDYLADLYSSSQTTVPFSLQFSRADGGCSLNDVSWDGSTSLGSIETGTIQEWTVRGNDKHPFHLHVNSYQLKGVTDSSNYFMAGDWHDVSYPPTSVSVDSYLFAVDSFVTKSVIHCHFLPHEDLGCMGYVQHTGSSGATTGLKGHNMTCSGGSTGTETFYTNCTRVASTVTAAPSITPTTDIVDTGDDDFCFHIDSIIDYKGVKYSYEELKAGKEPECSVPHAPSSRGVVITTSCGKSARVTDTHLMATTKGFQLAYSLKSGDILFGDYHDEKCIVSSVQKEENIQQYFGLNCVHSEVLTSGLRASTFGDFHTLPSWYMTYVGGLLGSSTASSLGGYIAEWYFQK